MLIIICGPLLIRAHKRVYLHICGMYAMYTHGKKIDESLFSEPPNAGLYDLLKQLFTFSLRVASPSLTLEMK